MPEIEDFGLQPKHECQVDCPVLKKVYETYKREADGLWKQADECLESTPESVMSVLRNRAAAYNCVCTSLALAFSPKAMAGFLQSMMCEDEEKEPE